MKILSVNAGSSSLKFTLFEMPEEKELISGVFERIGIENSFYTIKLNGEKIKKEAVLANHTDAVKILTQELLDNNIVEDLSEIKAIGHRMVHGGEKYASSVLLTDEVIKTVEELSDLAPLHNPANLVGVRAFMEVIPDAVSVGVFDTAFHQTMEEDKYLYPVPYEWYEDYGVRKYGFHGTSHKYVSQKMSEILGKSDAKIITCHIGNGGSLAAVKDAKCIDTSMGFTPNAGIIMGSRSGDIDASLIPYVMKKSGMSISDIDTALNKKSGLLGISGVSSDSRDIEDGIKSGNSRCELAQKMYVDKIVNYIAMYYVELGGVDAICFTAGIGEKSPLTRQQIIESISSLGAKLDPIANKERNEFTKISSSDSKIECFMVPTDEEVMIATDTYNLIEG